MSEKITFERKLDGKITRDYFTYGTRSGHVDEDIKKEHPAAYAAFVAAEEAKLNPAPTVTEGGEPAPAAAESEKAPVPATPAEPEKAVDPEVVTNAPAAAEPEKKEEIVQ